MFRRMRLGRDIARLMMNMKSEYTAATDPLVKEQLSTKAKKIFVNDFDPSLVDHDLAMNQKAVTTFLMMSVPFNPNPGDSLIAQCLEWSFANAEHFDMRNLANFVQVIIAFHPRSTAQALIEKHIVPILLGREKEGEGEGGFPSDPNKQSVVTLINAFGKLLSDLEGAEKQTTSCLRALKVFLKRCDKRGLLKECGLGDWGVLVASLHKAGCLSNPKEELEGPLQFLTRSLDHCMRRIANQENLSGKEIGNFIATVGRVGLSFTPGMEGVMVAFLRVLPTCHAQDVVHFFAGVARLLSQQSARTASNVKLTRRITASSVEVLRQRKNYISISDASTMLSALSRLKLGTGAVPPPLLELLCERCSTNMIHADVFTVHPAMQGAVNLLLVMDDAERAVAERTVKGLFRSATHRLSDLVPLLSPNATTQCLAVISQFCTATSDFALFEEMAPLLAHRLPQQDDGQTTKNLPQLVELLVFLEQNSKKLTLTGRAVGLAEKLERVAEQKAQRCTMQEIVSVLNHVAPTATAEGRDPTPRCSLQFLSALFRAAARCLTEGSPSPYEVRAIAELSGRFNSLSLGDIPSECQQDKLHLAEVVGEKLDALFSTGTATEQLSPKELAGFLTLKLEQQRTTQGDKKGQHDIDQLLKSVPAVSQRMSAHESASTINLLSRVAESPTVPVELLAEAIGALGKRLESVQEQLSVPDCTFVLTAVNKIAADERKLQALAEMLKPPALLAADRLSYVAHGRMLTSTTITKALQTLATFVGETEQTQAISLRLLQHLQHHIARLSLLEASLVLAYASRLKVWDPHVMNALLQTAEKKLGDSTLSESAALLLTFARYGLAASEGKATDEVPSAASAAWKTLLKRFVEQLSAEGPSSPPPSPATSAELPQLLQVFSNIVSSTAVESFEVRTRLVPLLLSKITKGIAVVGGEQYVKDQPGTLTNFLAALVTLQGKKGRSFPVSVLGEDVLRPLEPLCSTHLHSLLAATPGEKGSSSTKNSKQERAFRLWVNLFSQTLHRVQLSEQTKTVLRECLLSVLGKENVTPIGQQAGLCLAVMQLLHPDDINVAMDVDESILKAYLTKWTEEGKLLSHPRLSPVASLEQLNILLLPTSGRGDDEETVSALRRCYFDLGKEFLRKDLPTTMELSLFVPLAPKGATRKEESLSTEEATVRDEVARRLPHWLSQRSRQFSLKQLLEVTAALPWWMSEEALLSVHQHQKAGTPSLAESLWNQVLHLLGPTTEGHVVAYLIGSVLPRCKVPPSCEKALIDRLHALLRSNSSALSAECVSALREKLPKEKPPKKSNRLGRR